jgi:hypothetical protein
LQEAFEEKATGVHGFGVVQFGKYSSVFLNAVSHIAHPFADQVQGMCNFRETIPAAPFETPNSFWIQMGLGMHHEKRNCLFGQFVANVYVRAVGNAGFFEKRKIRPWI